jgi:hypothetical protein
LPSFVFRAFSAVEGALKARRPRRASPLDRAEGSDLHAIVVDGVGVAGANSADFRCRWNGTVICTTGSQLWNVRDTNSNEKMIVIVVTEMAISAGD